MLHDIMNVVYFLFLFLFCSSPSFAFLFSCLVIYPSLFDIWFHSSTVLFRSTIFFYRWSIVYLFYSSLPRLPSYEMVDFLIIRKSHNYNEKPIDDKSHKLTLLIIPTKPHVIGSQHTSSKMIRAIWIFQMNIWLLASSCSWLRFLTSNYNKKSRTIHLQNHLGNIWVNFVVMWYKRWLLGASFTPEK